MANLILPDFQVGMIVVTPASNVPNITEDTKYVILDIEGDFIQIQDDTGKLGFYESFLFIEPDVYYNMIMYLSLLRLFELNPKDLK